MFALRPAFDWRGLGEVAASALAIRPQWSAWDAEVKFGLTTHSVADNKACECGAILQGAQKPQDCKVFATVCTLGQPAGRLYGVQRRRLRGALRLWPFCQQGAGMSIKPGYTARWT